MGWKKNDNQEYFSHAVEFVTDRFGGYYVETGAALIQLDRYNSGSSLLDAAEVSEQQIQEMMQSLFRMT